MASKIVLTPGSGTDDLLTIPSLRKSGYQFKALQMPDLTVRPGPVEGWAALSWMPKIQKNRENSYPLFLNHGVSPWH
jgi:hypothetical protein